MHDRLKQFLSMEGLTPARFAEVMGIQRSGISHLLSGRNKPSFEFLEKMMNAYPEINPEWLILGKGRPYKSEHFRETDEQQIDLFTEFPESSTGGEPSLSSDDQYLDEPIEPEQRVENRKFASDPIAPRATNVKKITRIIVFFNDGTYEEK